MQNRNPYAAPQTNVTRERIASKSTVRSRSSPRYGRLGRVRYIGYTMGV